MSSAGRCRPITLEPEALGGMLKFPRDDEASIVSPIIGHSFKILKTV